MKNARKIQATFVAVGLLALSGCGPTNEGGTSSAFTSSDATVSIDKNIKEKISILIPSGNQNETTMIDSAIKGFNLIYPNVTVEENYVQVGNYESTVRNLYMADALPDIVWTNSPEFYYLKSLGLIDPLNNYLSASEKAGDFNFKNDFKTKFFEMGAQDGLYYVIPRSADTVVTFYNKKILTDAHIDISTIKEGWSWEDFTAICAKWRAYMDQAGHTDDYFCCDFNFTWSSVTYPLIRSYGGEVIDSTGSAALKSDGTKQALTMMRDLVDKRYSVGNGVTSGSSFETATCPFIFQSAAISHYDSMRALKGNIDLVSFPKVNGTNFKIGAGIAGYSLTSKAKNKALSWAFLNYLISHDGQEALAAGGLNLPSIRNDLADYSASVWGKGYTDRNLQAYLDFDENKIADEYLGRISPSAMADVELAYSDVIGNTLSGKATRKTIDQVITLGQSDIQSAIDDHK